MSEAERNVTPFWPNSSWAIILPAVAFSTDFTFKLDNYLDVDARAVVYFEVCGGAKAGGAYLDTKAALPPSFYLVAFRDGNGDSLRGEENYMLHVPANVPTELFWSISLYDRATCGFIREMPRAGLDSYDQKVAKNEDGSVDIYIGPKSPAGKEANWVQTVPGREWFPYFRLYGPEKPFFDKTWVLPAINHVD